ncbi:hypothetical protein ScalyP_jg7541 [Parmales sp. scaly parma]|nr:hypothetical protein ScalyP_jg7541 [Parmales sp. scaly parma]
MSYYLAKALANSETFSEYLRLRIQDRTLINVFGDDKFPSYITVDSSKVLLSALQTRIEKHPETDLVPIASACFLATTKHASTLTLQSCFIPLHSLLMSLVTRSLLRNLKQFFKQLKIFVFANQPVNEKPILAMVDLLLMIALSEDDNEATKHVLLRFAQFLVFLHSRKSVQDKKYIATFTQSFSTLATKVAATYRCADKIFASLCDYLFTVPSTEGGRLCLYHIDELTNGNRVDIVGNCLQKSKNDSLRLLTEYISHHALYRIDADAFFKVLDLLLMEALLLYEIILENNSNNASEYFVTLLKTVRYLTLSTKPRPDTFAAGLSERANKISFLVDDNDLLKNDDKNENDFPWTSDFRPVPRGKLLQTFFNEYCGEGKITKKDKEKETKKKFDPELTVFSYGFADILCRLSYQRIKMCRLVSRSWRDFIDTSIYSDYLWKEVYFVHGFVVNKKRKDMIYHSLFKQKIVKRRKRKEKAARLFGFKMVDE